MDLEDVYDAYKLDPSFKHLRDIYNFVPGMGNPNAELLFVGEAPGQTENTLKVPFCGVSGRILDRMLDSIGLDRSKCYVTNLLKYRPSETNRDPNPQELIDSIPYLTEEIRIIKPRLVVSLGTVPARAFLPGHRFKDVKGSTFALTPDIDLFVTYHPAYISYNRSAEAEYLEHFKLIKEYVDGATAERIL